MNPVAISEPVVQITEEDYNRALITHALSEKRGGGLGFCGAHRTGKTTLCSELAGQNPGIPMLATSTSELAKRAGFDVNNPGDFENRLSFQELVLSYYIGLWEKQHTLFWTDRTPLDMAAYLLAEVPTGEIASFVDFRVQKYVQRAMQAANDYFMTIIAVQPGIPFKEEEGKPAPNVGYQEKLNAIMIGLGRSLYRRPFYVIDRRCVAIAQRVRLATDIVSTVIQEHSTMMQWLSVQ